VTPILTAITPSASLSFLQLSLMLTATNGQTSPTPIPLSLNRLEELRLSLTSALQQGSVTPSAKEPPASVSMLPPLCL
jgi:hypothetical protein